MQKLIGISCRFMNYIYKSFLQFCLWCEIPLKLLKVYIINVQDCSFTCQVFLSSCEFSSRFSFLFKNNIGIQSLISATFPQTLWRVHRTLKIPWPIMYTGTTVLGEFSELQYSLSPSYQAARLLVSYAQNDLKFTRRSLSCLCSRRISRMLLTGFPR